MSEIGKRKSVSWSKYRYIIAPSLIHDGDLGWNSKHRDLPDCDRYKKHFMMSLSINSTYQPYSFD